MGNARIMIVEDETIVAKNIEERLSMMGYDVCATLTSGEMAVRSAGTVHPDLILMDIKLQGKLTGIEAAEKIKTQYLVDAMTCTEAEARTRTYLKDSVMDYEIVSTTKSPIEDVIEVPVKA